MPLNVAFDHGGARILQGNALDVLAELPADYYHAVITSPPYWGLRSYCKADSAEKQYELGSEKTPAEYIAAQVAVFRECRRVLHPTGILVINIGDTYAGGGRGGYPAESAYRKQATNSGSVMLSPCPATPGVQDGEPVGIPDMLKNALRADGWRHRDTVIWAKPAPMPGSMMGWRWEKHRVKVKKTDRAANAGRDGDLTRQGAGVAARAQREEYNATKAEAWADCPGCPKCLPHGGYVLRKGQWRTTSSHEYCFIFVKSDRYYADAAGVKEPAKYTAVWGGERFNRGDNSVGNNSDGGGTVTEGGTRNPRSVQTWGPEPCKFSHYASFPRALPRFYIKAATSPKGCCPTCGIPYSPVVEAEYVANRPSAGNDPRSVNEDRAAEGRGHGGWQGNNLLRRDIVGGYRPSCSCPPLPSVPCRVFDPYAGTGTTLVAALELGCEADGIELKPQYVSYAIERLSAYLVPKGQAPAVEAGGPLWGEGE